LPFYNEELLFLEKKYHHDAEIASKKGGMAIPK
jgi:hypothetical protein